MSGSPPDETPAPPPEPGATPPARLEIRIGAHVHVILEGDAAFVMQAYERVQKDVAEAVLREQSDERDERGEAAKGKRAPRSPERRREGRSDRLGASEDILWVYRCEDELRTVYATQRSQFADTRFAKALGIGGVERVFVEDDRLLRALRRGSRTLWRELEPEGLRRIKEAAEKAGAARAEAKDG